jgi:3-hydroxypropionate dehydrogenase (NADP+)
MPLVEIVPGEFTSQDTINEVKAFMMKIGKVPVILKKEIPGYIGNRLSAALWREAINLIDKGVASAEEIDKVVCYSLGIRWAIMGPFLTYHLSGGSGGIRYHFEHLEPTFSLLWKTMNIWTKIPKTIKEKVISEVEQMSMIRSKNIKELTIWRDEKLVNLIKTLNLVDLKKSTKNKIKKGE